MILALLLLAAPNVLRVYTKPIEPFSYKKDGADAGFSIELWDRVAKEAGLKYETTWVKTVPELIAALEAGKADVAVAAISITSEREKVIDFSQPYYESGLQILVGPGGPSSAATLVNTLFTWDFARLLGMLALALFVSSNLLWWFERRNNEENFPRPYRHGVWESLWWTSSVLITGGCENKTPTGIGGRMVAVVWMLTGILLVSYITASVTSAMTVKSLTSGINGPSDLPGQIVGTRRQHRRAVSPRSQDRDAVVSLGGRGLCGAGGEAGERRRLRRAGAALPRRQGRPGAGRRPSIRATELRDRPAGREQAAQADQRDPAQADRDRLHLRAAPEVFRRYRLSARSRKSAPARRWMVRPR